MRPFILVTVLAAFIAVAVAIQQREDAALETPKPIKVQTGLITIKQAKPQATAERHHGHHRHRPRGARNLRKTVVKITQTSPMVAPTTATKTQLTAVPFQNELSPTNPLTNTANIGSLSYQYNPGSFVLSPGMVINYDHKQQKYTYRQQRAPATFQPSTPILYNDYDGGIYFQSPYIQTAAYMTPPAPEAEMYSYAPAYIPATTTEPKKKIHPTITKARTVPVAIYYAEESPEPFQEEPATTATPIRFSYPKKKLRVKKIPAKQTVSSPPTVTYHSYKIPLPYTTTQEQQQLQQPYAQNVYSTTPQFTFYRQPLAEPPTIASTPYYHNSATVYNNPYQSYTAVGSGAASGATGGKVTSTKLRPTGLGISYSPVGPGIASYNFQGFGVEYGY